MQTLIQIHCRGNKSLREAIAKDRALKAHGLEVVTELKPGRQPGWLKVRGTQDGRRGVLNITWDSAARVLSCRVVNRGGTRPHLLVGDFVDYVLDRWRKRIQWLSLTPR